MEGRSGYYKTLKQPVNLRARGRRLWVKVGARVIKPDGHRRMRHKEGQCSLDGRVVQREVVMEQGRDDIGWLIVLSFLI